MSNTDKLQQKLKIRDRDTLLTRQCLKAANVQAEEKKAQNLISTPVNQLHHKLYVVEMYCRCMATI